MPGDTAQTIKQPLNCQLSKYGKYTNIFSRYYNSHKSPWGAAKFVFFCTLWRANLNKQTQARLLWRPRAFFIAPFSAQNPQRPNCRSETTASPVRSNQAGEELQCGYLPVEIQIFTLLHFFSHLLVYLSTNFIIFAIERAWNASFSGAKQPSAEVPNQILMENIKHSLLFRA